VTQGIPEKYLVAYKKFFDDHIGMTWENIGNLDVEELENGELEHECDYCRAKKLFTKELLNIIKNPGGSHH
jgi:hypothetical protein